MLTLSLLTKETAYFVSSLTLELALSSLTVELGVVMDGASEGRVEVLPVLPPHEARDLLAKAIRENRNFFLFVFISFISFEKLISLFGFLKNFMRL